MAALRTRFDKQLPKYGFLWRSMAHAPSLFILAPIRGRIPPRSQPASVSC